MEVKVGDWIRLRGMRRIYEVAEIDQTREWPGGKQTLIRVEGLAGKQLAEHVIECRSTTGEVVVAS